jgi:hypothetical protein
VPLSLPIDAEANELLSRSPLALLIGMPLDQYIHECMLSAWARVVRPVLEAALEDSRCCLTTACGVP